MEQRDKRNIHPFNGEKYSVWKFRIRSLLDELNVLHVIDEETPATANNEWRDDDSVAKNTIIDYLEDSLLSFAEVSKTARQVFQKLDEIYERKSVATQLAVRKRLLNLKLKGDMPLIKHFMQFDEMINEVIGAGGKLKESDKILLLLLTLPTVYESVIPAIEKISEDNLSLAFVKVRLLDHEVKLRAESADTSSKVLQVFNKKPYKYDNRQNTNKFIKFKKNKFIKCHYCGKNGHIKRHCFKYINKNKTNNTYNNNNRNQPQQVIETIQTTQTATNESANNAFAFMIRRENYQNYDNTVFALESSASDHITNNSDLFLKCVDLKPPIRISTAKRGTFIEATKKGSIQVVTNLGIKGVIENVLFCKDVPNNLLSVGKLQQAGMEVKFDKQGACILRDGVTMAHGECINWLYGFKFIINIKKPAMYL